MDDGGRFDWNADAFAALRILDDWAASHDASILFTPWEIPVHWAYGKGEDGVFHGAPRDIPAFVKEFVVPLAEHLLRDLGLKTVKHLVLVNEPGMSGPGYGTPPGIDPYEHYVACHRAVWEAFERRGLLLKLIGPDTSTSTVWAVDHFIDRGLDLSPYIDAYDQHHYYGRFDYLPPNPLSGSLPLSDVITYTEKNARFARMHGKRYWITELGTFYYGWYYGDVWGGCTHEAFLTEAEFIVRALQAGCGGFYRWQFTSPGEHGDGVWQFVDTVDGSFARRPHTYYGYASLMRSTSRNAAVWKTEVSERPDFSRHVHAAGLENPDGTRTLIVINDHNCQERIVEICLPEGWDADPWQRFLDDRVRKMVRSEAVVTLGRIEDCLPPLSMAVYTTRRLPDDGLLPQATERKPEAR